ncbi:MAG TPA: hypothetical protein VFL59_10375, partial [Candidatus Nanopelagicales bacterium]|nr:hypothetical protein [Candidatus Nanopelagicales bacterium]
MAPDPTSDVPTLVADLRSALGPAPLVVQLVDSMPASGSRPLLAAAVAREAGWASVVVAIVTAGSAGRSEIDGIPVLAVPVGTAYRDLAKASALDSARLESWVVSRDRALTLSVRAADGDLRARARWTSSRRSLLDQGSVPTRTAAAEPPTGRWVSAPTAVDLELAVASVLDPLAPAVVHAYGASLAPASRTTRFARVRGDGIALVADLVPPLPTAEQLASADATVAPLPFLADDRSTVLAGPASAPLPALTRTRIALGDDEQLVAVRWVPGRTTAVEAVVDALESTPGLHALIYASRSGPALTALLADAQRRGVRGRLHTDTGAGPAVLAGADATVLTASGDAVPVDLLDAVSLGIPVVGPSAPTFDGLVAREGFGRAHDGTSAGVGAALREVLADSAVRASAGR